MSPSPSSVAYESWMTWRPHHHFRHLVGNRKFNTSHQPALTSHVISSSRAEKQHGKPVSQLFPIHLGSHGEQLSSVMNLTLINDIYEAFVGYFFSKQNTEEVVSDTLEMALAAHLLLYSVVSGSFPKNKWPTFPLSTCSASLYVILFWDHKEYLWRSKMHLKTALVLK